MVVLARYSEPTSTGIDIGVIYASSAAKVRRLVRHTVRAPDPLIDDACQTAWTRLIRDRERVRAPDAVVGWLVTTAVREALKLTRRAARELFLEELLDETGELHELAGAPEPEDIVDDHLRLESLRLLPERQQRLVWLQALGWTYIEMSELTGDTPRTIDRQLVRARHAIAAAAAPNGG
jgi:RNA polymerase sigma factor (sigma-70 family)